jgi:hypothetical protein
MREFFQEISFAQSRIWQCNRKMKPPPQIICRQLPEFEPDNLDTVRNAFQNAAACDLQQAWLEKPESSFAPAKAQTGWRNNSLLIFAELTDADIFTRATAHNQRFWELGDTFEIFLRPIEQQTYLEFHVAPNNLRLQLRFPDADAVKRAAKTNSFENFLIHGESVFQSQTWTQPENSRWLVFAEILARAVAEKPKPLAESEWLFSFSRYDCARGRIEPVISSTSPHTPPPDFHRQHDWGKLIFQK